VTVPTAGMTASMVLAAEQTGSTGFGLVIVLAIIGVLGWVVARSMQRQRDYERRLHEHPDGVHGSAPEDDPDAAPDEPEPDRPDADEG